MIVENQVKVGDTQVKVEAAQAKPEQERPMIANAFGKMMLAAIGAVGLAQDSLEALLNRMVERGELTQKDAQKLMSQMRARRSRMMRRASVSAEAAMEEHEPASKADIDSLTEQIAKLNAKIDLLTREQASSSLPTPPKTTTK